MRKIKGKIEVNIVYGPEKYSRQVTWFLDIVYSPSEFLYKRIDSSYDGTWNSQEDEYMSYDQGLKSSHLTKISLFKWDK